MTIFDVIDKEIEYLKSAPPPNQIDPQQWNKEKKILLNRFEWSKPIVAIGLFVLYFNLIIWFLLN